jgi:alkylation response protein AidB-like acyl-CoA dehydrogenase
MAELVAEVDRFMREVVLPREDDYYREIEAAEFKWTLMPSLMAMRAEAKAARLWCFPVPEEVGGAGAHPHAICADCGVDGAVADWDGSLQLL